MTLHPAGTRVRLFPEFYGGYAAPELAFLSPRPGTVGVGPVDDQLYVANARDKREPYAPPDAMPPYRGPEYPPARPGRGGHFDHIPVDAPQFLATHVYGAARHTLDIWEHYLGRRVQWWHAPEIPRLEIVPVVAWANAHSGPGFLETGVIRNDAGQDHRFALNFDVIAHEIGHAVLFATVGVPAPEAMTAEYLAFHESFSDLFGLVGVLRFASVVRRLLAQTGGNLYALNMVTRLGRYSDNQQVRIASNRVTMDDVAGIRLRADGSWDDPSGQDRNQHALGEPLTGAVFDMLVTIFEEGLTARGVLGRGLDGRGWNRAALARAMPAFRLHHARALHRRPEAYDAALLEARDVVGFAMAHAMRTLHPETLTFGRVAARMLEAAAALGHARDLGVLLPLFLDRGIDPRPFLRIVRGRFCCTDRPLAVRATGADAFLHAHDSVREGHCHHSAQGCDGRINRIAS